MVLKANLSPSSIEWVPFNFRGALKVNTSPKFVQKRHFSGTPIGMYSTIQILWHILETLREQSIVLSQHGFNRGML